MELFRIETDFDESHNSPWDALWYEGELEDLLVLQSEFSLAAVWKPPTVTYERRVRTPDIFRFMLHYAVSEEARNIIVRLTKDSVEFLPLAIPKRPPLYVLHPLHRVDFDEKAVVTTVPTGKNIIMVSKYSFVREDIDEGTHIFQARQGHGSHSRDAGIAYLSIFVSRKFRNVCDSHELKGIAFDPI